LFLNEEIFLILLRIIFLHRLFFGSNFFKFKSVFDYV
jgi:hypothetical protein